MALKDIFSRRSSTDAGSESAPTEQAEPGSPSSQLDGSGDGPVTLEQRTEPGGKGSPDTNQGKTEPLPSTPGHADPNAEFEPPTLAEMNVGGADPQSPSHGLARDRDVPTSTAPVLRTDPGVAPHEDRPAIDPDSGTVLPEGPERPDQVTEGTAQRQPGSAGDSPEQQETDVDTGAANMLPVGGPDSVPSAVQPGDAQEVPVPHEVPMPGTSEQLPVAEGIRSPEA